MAKSDEIEITAELVYQDPERALAWLEAAFGFQTRMVVRDGAQRLVFAETGLGEFVVAVGSERPWLRSPKTAGVATQGVRFRILQDVDAHCARALAAGATILREPETFFFGDRSYDAADHEGHVWSFNQRIADAAEPPPPGWTTSFSKPAG